MSRPRAASAVLGRARTYRARVGRGKPAHVIGEDICLSRLTVQRWLDRYETDGIAGIEEDRPRPGRPRMITAEIERDVIHRTLHEEPPDEGTHRSQRRMAAATGLHNSQVGRIWNAHGPKPHQVEYLELSKDPRFVEKLRDVLGLYVAPPERAIILSFDEKSQIQALDRTQPGPLLRKGRAGTMTLDCKCHGTTTLFAAVDVATGEVIHESLRLG